ncbi:MAG: MFS transporter [Desulfobacterales bacterium]|nr:MFS transporter [Desulfobacterales bacterium]
MPKERITQGLNLVSIATAHGFSDGFHYVLVPVLPLIMQELGLSILQTGMIVSAQGLAIFLMLMPASILSDYLGRRKVILTAGLILAAFSFMGIGLVGKNYYLILVLSFLVGLGNSTFHPTATALVSEAFRTRPGFYMGMFSLGGNIGSAVMPAVIGTLALTLGWRAGLQFIMLPVIGVAVLVYRFLPETRGSRQNAREMFSGIWDKVCCNLPVVTLIVIYSLRGIGYRGIITFFPLLIAATMGADARTAGFLMSVYFFMGAVSKPLLGMFYDRFGVRLLLAALFLLGAAATVALTRTTHLAVMVSLMGLLGVVSFISPIVMTAATSLVDNSVRTSTVGMIYTAYEIQFLSPIFGGWIAQTYSLKACFIFFAGVLVLGSVASLLLQEKRIPKLKDI